MSAVGSDQRGCPRRRGDRKSGSLHVSYGSSLCENSDVELARRNFVSVTLNRKRTALAVAVERGKGRKQFCAFSARARFHTGWTQSGLRFRRTFTRLAAVTMLEPWPRLALFFSIS